MNSLFSHAVPEPSTDPTGEPAGELPALTYTVTVPSSVEHAFAGFTDHTHLWWPLETHSVYGAASYVEFEGNMILETADNGESTLWGSIEQWNPPFAFRADWHPGKPSSSATQLSLLFEKTGEGTRLTLTHDGFEHADDPGAVRADYETGWPEVLSRYVRFMGGTA